MVKRIKIQLEDKVVVLMIEDGEEVEMNIDDMLKIDYSNVIGELLTFPVIFNRIGIMKAQVENSLRRKKFDVDIYKAQLSEQFRKKLSVKSFGTKGEEKWKAPVKDEVENSVLKDLGYQNKMKELFTEEKNCSYIDSLYWSAKSKDDKLKALSHHIPQEFENEIIDSTINGIKIKGIDKAFKSKINKQ